MGVQSAEVVVTARGAARIRGGHPWVFQPDVAKTRGEGDVVSVRDGRGALLGTALHAPGAKLPLRMLGREALAFDERFIAGRVEAALARRNRLGERDAFRVLHGEADGLPGLIVDRYRDVAVVQTLARAMDARKDAI